MTSILSSGTVEVAVCLAFIYLLLSLLCSVVNEWIAGIMGSRAYNLERGIRSLFTHGMLNNTTSLSDALYAHGLIQSLYSRGFWDKVFLRRGGPSYIPPSLFSTTLLNLLAPGPNATTDPVGTLRTAIANLPASAGKEALSALANQGQTKIEDIKQSLEDWYNDGMDRVAGWYKRRTTLVLFALGLVVAIVTNSDSFLVGRTLWNNPALRQATITAADQYVQAHKPPESGDKTADAQQVKTTLNDLNSQLQTLQLPVGWPAGAGGQYSILTDVGGAVRTLLGKSSPQPAYDRSFPTDTRLAWFRILGWGFTAAALSLGAPFWFDLLNKFMLVRSAVKPEEKKDDDTK